MTTVDLKSLLDSKKRLRSKLAAMPYSEKLRLLELMRDRHLALAAARKANDAEKR